MRGGDVTEMGMVGPPMKVAFYRFQVVLVTPRRELRQNTSNSLISVGGIEAVYCCAGNAIQVRERAPSLLIGPQ
ncbi:hypothetical protein BK665_03415 [Pseudomonas frederiksbergensis]|uniref:Uncharacterized protein n=1 Tax=Pseudomonas frederiksbergensis TaxID=104087 RepID=A0A423KRB2_9PSED|nr:hypothetical protein BK665_03415 [Pseudomonas frederiksbergensis]